jgi:NAD-dependent deacetylase
MWGAEPNAGHRAIVALERQGRLVAVVTQNIDELHQAAGNDPAKVVEVHGTARRTMCWSCDDRRPMTETLDRVRAGEADPPCLLCGGILKSDTISFGQSLVAVVIVNAEPTAMDDLADAVVRGSISVALPSLVGHGRG